MIGHITFSLIPPILGVVISVGIGIYAWLYRQKHGALQFSWLAWTGAIWSLRYVAESIGYDGISQFGWDMLQFALLLLWPLLFLRFALHYPEPVKRRLKMLWIGLALLGCVLLAGTIVQQIPSATQSLTDRFPNQQFAAFIENTALMTQIRFVWSGGLFAVGFFLLLKALIVPRQHSRRPITIVIIGALIAATGVILTISDFSLSIYAGNPSPLTFGLGNLLMAWGILRSWPAKLVPQARNALFGTLPAGVAVINAKGCLIDLNAEAESLLAPLFPPEKRQADLVGKPIEDLFTAWPDFLQWYREHPEGSTKEIPLKVDEDHMRNLSVTVAALRNRRGRLRGQLVTLYDITARIRTEDALQHTEADLQETSATLQATETRLQETQETLGHAEDTLRQTEATLQETETARNQLEESLHVNEEKIRQTEDALKASEEERERQEEALALARQNEQAAQAAAQTAEQARDRFLSTMSTAFYTPLNAILGFSKFITRDPRISPAQRENLAIIHTSGERLLSIIHDTLDMVAIESGVMTLQTQNCDLYHMLRDIEDAVGDRTSNSEVKCEFEQSAELPQYIHIDAYKLQHILRHSLDLAVKSTKQGSITFHAGLTTPDQSEAEIEDETQQGGNAPRIMLQFTMRYGDDGASPDDLTGEHDALGKALSRRFVELLHGQMIVESQDEGGFALRLTIPAESGEVRPSKAALVEKRQVIRVAPDDQSYRIVVVHRDTYSRQLLQRLLETIGFSVQEASSEEAVIEIAEHWQPHLLCLDMHMPGMNASAVVGVIRAKHYAEEPEEPLVAPKVFGLIVGRATEERDRALAAGCDDVLSTPFREPEIFGKIAAYLDVNYVYDTKTSQARQAGAAKTKRLPASQIPEHLAALPAEVLHALEVAAAQLNPFKLSMAVETIWLHDAALADTLESLAYQNNYKQLSSLVEKTAAIVGQEASSDET